MNFNFFNPYYVPGLKNSVFASENPPQRPALSQIQPALLPASAPVASVDLLADRVANGAPDLSIYPSGGMSYAPTRPGMSFEDMTGQPGPQMSYAPPGAEVWGPSVEAVAGSDARAFAQNFKKLGGMLSDRGQLPAVQAPPVGGGGRTFDVTPFLRKPLTRRAK